MQDNKRKRPGFMLAEALFALLVLGLGCSLLMESGRALKDSAKRSLNHEMESVEINSV